MKVCGVCNIQLEKSRRKYCSDTCTKKAFIARDPKRHLIQQRKSHIKIKYNLTWESYTELYNSQKGKCKICETPVKLMGSNAEHSEVARIDHSHRTGKIRGILCNECNKGLGSFKDNIKSLKNAISYLEDI